MWGVGGWATAAEELTPFLRGLRCPLSNKRRQSTYYAPGTVASAWSMSTLIATHTAQLLLNVALRAALGSAHGPSLERRRLEYQSTERLARRQRSQKPSPGRVLGTSGVEGLSSDLSI